MDDFASIGYVPAGIVIAWVVQQVKNSGRLAGLWLLGLCLALSVVFGVSFELYQSGAPNWGAVFRGVYSGFFLAMTTAKGVDLLKEFGKPQSE